MSEQGVETLEKGVRTSTPVSVYLSPRAMAVLKKYSDNSGFGSMSRTVEELILSYDKIYTTLVSTIAGSSIQAFFSNPQMIVMTFLIMINSLNLSDGSPFEQAIKKQIEQWVQSRAGK
jgi:hypothetical protein